MIDVVSPTEMKAAVVIKVGPVKASFAGEVSLSDLNPPMEAILIRLPQFPLAEAGGFAAGNVLNATKVTGIV